MDTKVHDIIKPKINIVRFAFLSAILCIIMVLSLSFYGDEFALIIKKLEGSDNDMENVIWIAKHIGNLLPTIAIVIPTAIPVFWFLNGLEYTLAVPRDANPSR